MIITCCPLYLTVLFFDCTFIEYLIIYFNPSTHIYTCTFTTLSTYVILSLIVHQKRIFCSDCLSIQGYSRSPFPNGNNNNNNYKNCHHSRSFTPATCSSMEMFEAEDKEIIDCYQRLSANTDDEQISCKISGCCCPNRISATKTTTATGIGKTCDTSTEITTKMTAATKFELISSTSANLREDGTFITNSLNVNDGGTYACPIWAADYSG